MDVGLYDGTTWILFIFLIIAIVTLVSLFALVFMGVNVATKIRKLMQKKDDIMEETTTYITHRTNSVDPPVVYDESSKCSDTIVEYSIHEGGRVTLYALDEKTGQKYIFDEIPHRDMIIFDDPLSIMKEVPGLRMRINKKSENAKIKMERDSLSIRERMLQAERKNISEKTVKSTIITEGENMKEVRIASYGNTRNPMLSRPWDRGRFENRNEPSEEFEGE